MPSRNLDFPVFDADNHMYETPDAFTKYLPAEYDGFIKYVQVDGRTKIAVNNKISDYIPNPTFERRGRARVPRRSTSRSGNPEGKSRREILGKGIKALPAFFDARAAAQALDELGIDRALMWPTLASLLEERVHDNPPAVHAVVHALNQWMAEHWTLQLREPHVPHAGDPPGHRRRGDQRARLGARAGRPRRADPPAPVWGFWDRGRPPCPSSTRSGPRWPRRASWSGCTRRTAGTSATPTSGRVSATAR